MIDLIEMISIRPTGEVNEVEKPKKEENKIDQINGAWVTLLCEAHLSFQASERGDFSLYQ